MTDDGPDPFTNMFEAPAKFARTLFAPLAEATAGTPLSPEDMRDWAEVGAKLQGLWMQFQTEQLTDPQALAPYMDPSRWMRMAEDWYRQMPLADPTQQQALWQEGPPLRRSALARAPGLCADPPDLSVPGRTRCRDGRPDGRPVRRQA